MPHTSDSPHPPPTVSSYAPHVPHPAEGSTSQHAMAEQPQGMTPQQGTASVADKREKAFCNERLKTIFPEVERARGGAKAAVEAKKTTREALDRKREKLKLEMKQQWDRYDRERVLELEREDRAILDAEENVRGLEDDYRKYKNREAAAEVRLRDYSNQPSDDADAHPSVAPVSPALPDTSTADPPYLQEMSTEFSEYRKL